jgi:uncharacterized protein (DUF1800 family)
LTGLTVNRDAETFEDRADLHDGNPVRLLGRRARMNETDVVTEVVSQAAAARFICARLWTFFASDTVPAGVVEALAEVFRGVNLNFKPVLRALFRSEEFYADTVVGGQIKSPVQWLVGTVRLLERDLPPPSAASDLIRRLGQELFAPSNVRGWEGSAAWITTQTLLTRYNQAEDLLRGHKSKGKVAVDLDFLLSASERQDRDGLLAALIKRFLHGVLAPERIEVLKDYLQSQGKLDDEDILTTIHFLMCTPEYQMT